MRCLLTAIPPCQNLALPSGVAARDGGRPRRRVNVLAFIQTGAALVLFQIQCVSVFSSVFVRKETELENKIVGSKVLITDAALVEEVP